MFIDLRLWSSDKMERFGVISWIINRQNICIIGHALIFDYMKIETEAPVV